MNGRVRVGHEPKCQRGSASISEASKGQRGVPPNDRVGMGRPRAQGLNVELPRIFGSKNVGQNVHDRFILGAHREWSGQDRDQARDELGRKSQ